MNMKFGQGLPASLEEINQIHRLREKRVSAVPACSVQPLTRTFALRRLRRRCRRSRMSARSNCDRRCWRIARSSSGSSARTRCRRSRRRSTRCASFAVVRALSHAWRVAVLAVGCRLQVLIGSLRARDDQNSALNDARVEKVRPRRRECLDDTPPHRYRLLWWFFVVSRCGSRRRRTATSCSKRSSSSASKCTARSPSTASGRRRRSTSATSLRNTPATPPRSAACWTAIFPRLAKLPTFRLLSLLSHSGVRSDHARRSRARSQSGNDLLMFSASLHVWNNLSFMLCKLAKSAHSINPFCIALFQNTRLSATTSR
jgi:hypothetical protein